MRVYHFRQWRWKTKKNSEKGESQKRHKKLTNTHSLTYSTQSLNLLNSLTHSTHSLNSLTHSLTHSLAHLLLACSLRAFSLIPPALFPPAAILILWFSTSLAPLPIMFFFVFAVTEVAPALASANTICRSSVVPSKLFFWDMREAPVDPWDNKGFPSPFTMSTVPLIRRSEVRRSRMLVSLETWLQRFAVSCAERRRCQTG